MPRSTIAYSVRDSGSGRTIHILPSRTSSGGSASARSPLSSASSPSTDSWTHLSDDDIEPSDSASRSRGHKSRRHTVEVPSAPRERTSSRRVVVDREGSRHRERERTREREREGLPSRTRSTRDHRSRRESSRPARASSHRVPSDESTSTSDLHNDYPPYGPSGMPRAPHSQYRHGPAGPPVGAYPPSIVSGGYSHDPYAPQDHRQAVMRMGHDGFGYPSPLAGNPFAPQGQAPNPFSPMPSEGTSYFPGAPEAPQMSMRPPPPRQQYSEHDVHARQRPQSFAAPSHYPSSEMMPYQTSPGMAPYGFGMPGYPPYGPMPGWSMGGAPQDKEKEKEKEKDKGIDIEALKALVAKRHEEEKKEKDVKADEIAALKELIKKHEQERAAQERAWRAEKEAEAAARAAEAARAEEEKKRKQELDDARKKAKEDAEKKAEEAAKKAKEEHEKKLAEAEKAKADTEKAKKDLEEQIEKTKPTPDSLKAPIKFKDAVGRKFSFPWHICKTWKGMEQLIKQAFLHVDMIGEHVHAGHYDLTGPDGEIILPQVWDTMVKPDWEITMHLWPMEEEKKPDPVMELNDPFAALSMGGPGGPMGMDPFGHEPMKKGKKDKGKKGDKAKKSSSPEIVMMPPMPPMPPPGGGMSPPGGGGGYGDPFGGFAGGPFPAAVTVVPDKKDKGTKGRSKSSSAKISPLAAWFAGGNVGKPPKRK